MTGSRAEAARTDAVTIRPYHRADLEPVLELLSISLGWELSDRTRAFFTWKHLENAFGPSAMWVAEHDGDVVGFRSFMRWRMTVDGTPVDTVRAVDTATHPAWRGRGLFSTLTQHGLEALERSGVAFVFNTPNGQSRPGYLKMGWEEVGNLPLVLRPRSVFAASRLMRSRVAAEKWSLDVRTGTSALAALDDATVGRASAETGGVRTVWSADALRWRYGFEPLHYRALALDDDPERGIAIFRVRTRGSVDEVAVSCTIGVRAAVDRSRLLGQVLRATGADVGVALGDPDPKRLVLPARRFGPTLTCRPLDRAPAPPLRAWRLTLGDVELF